MADPAFSMMRSTDEFIVNAAGAVVSAPEKRNKVVDFTAAKK
jgi:hypothetical protein